LIPNIFGVRARVLALLLCLALPEVALLGFFSAGSVLAWPASQPQHADVIVVLGGDGTNGRFARGLELLHAGYSSQLVLIEPNPADRKNALANVPGVLIWDGLAPVNSWGEARVTRDRMLALGWRTALVVSDPPHLLRVAYAWSSNFWGTGLSYTLIETRPPWWSAWRWWANPYASSFVGDEVLKLGYYVVRYRFGLF
jgi:uncharacterized SAM-binding protein YcdF (DUF218 family)